MSYSLRTKFFLTCYFCFLFNLYSFAQVSNNGSFSFGIEHYQSVFFNPFQYSDFSFKYENNLILSDSVGKRIGFAASSFLNINDSILLDTIKAKSNVFFVLGTQKNQCLQVENIQKVGENSFVYFNYSSLASLGFLKNSSSRNRSFNLKLNLRKKIYSLSSDFTVVSNNDGSDGGIKDTLLDGAYSKRDLQQLDVNLNTDYLKKNLFKINLSHDFSLIKSSDNKRQLSILVGNQYSKYGYKYFGEGITKYYSNTNYDSTSTKDTIGYFWLRNDIGLKFNYGKFVFIGSTAYNDYHIRVHDSLFDFNDWSLKSKIQYNSKNIGILLFGEKVISNNFRKNNFNIGGRFTYCNFLKKLSEIDYNISYGAANVPFVFQKYYSNHFIWDSYSDESIKFLVNEASIVMFKHFIFAANVSSFKNRIYLNDSIYPVQSKQTENLISFKLSVNDTIGKFHLINLISYNSSSSSNLHVIPIQNYFRLGYFLNLFKNNLKMETGISIVYSDSWYANSYCPALDDFYLQSKKKFDGIPIVSAFADFKIKAATLFLKVERLNIGWANENNFVREGYIAPPRTIRFGLNWPLSN